MSAILVDWPRGGRSQGLIDVARDRYLRFLQRSDGPIKFVEGKPFVKQDVFLRLDPETGRAISRPSKQPGTNKVATYCPSLWGGKNWPPIAFSPKTRMIYVPANENLCQTLSGQEEVEYTPGKGYTGSRNGGMSIQPGADHVGRYRRRSANCAPGQVWTPAAPSPEGAMLVTGRSYSRSYPTTQVPHMMQPLESCCPDFPTTVFWPPFHS